MSELIELIHQTAQLRRNAQPQIVKIPLISLPRSEHSSLACLQERPNVALQSRLIVAFVVLAAGLAGGFVRLLFCMGHTRKIGVAWTVVEG